MSQRNLFVDAFELPTTQYEIHEAAPAVDDSPNAGVVDGENVLARVVGPFFLVDGKSRNGRFYTRQLWETAIKRTNDRLRTGQMLGTIGHSQSLDDAALLQGLVSHRVARLWIDEKAGVGMGEILVLNTPSGRVLNAYLRGGVQFPVSSRGYGGFRQEKRDGVPVIDEESFELETFDFVRVPGVTIAVPTLVESLDTEAAQLHDALLEEDTSEPLYNERQTVPTKTLEEREMSEETAATIAALARQKAQVENDLTTAYADVEQLRSKNEALEAQLEEARDVSDELSRYKHLGTVAAIQEVFERFREVTSQNKKLAGLEEAHGTAAAELEGYRELGSVEDLHKAIDIAEHLLEGADEAVTNAGAIGEQLAELGSPEEVSAALDLLESYTALGTPTDVKQATDLLEMYVDMGSLSEVEALVARTEQLAEALNEQKRQGQVAALAEETGAPTDVVEELLESFGEEGARSMLSRLGGFVGEGKTHAPKAAKARPVFPVSDDEEEEEDDAADFEGADDEELTEHLGFAASRPSMSRAGSLTMSLMEQYSRSEEESVPLEEAAPANGARAPRLSGLMESCGH